MMTDNDSMINATAAVFNDVSTENGTDRHDDVLLMCKDTPVFNVSKDCVLNDALLPGAIKRGTLPFSAWMKTRYSAGSNTSARRMMLRALGTDNHNKTLKATRALSLSDCYWLKQRSETVIFDEVTPYLNKEWDGTGAFTGGSISTLFVNGAADKRWLNAQTLLKVASYKELEPYRLCEALGLAEYAAEAKMSGDGIRVANFTSTSCFLESMEQSGEVDDTGDARQKAVELFKERAVALFVIDYLVEHDDRHWGNFGFLRSADTGAYLEMAPYYDFDWAWSDGVVQLPANAIKEYPAYIASLCDKAKKVSGGFEHGAVIAKRAGELSGQL
jgi:hypothetical protein